MFSLIFSGLGEYVAPRPSLKDEFQLHLKSGNYNIALNILRKEEHGININDIILGELSPIHISCAGGSLELTLELITQGADVNILTPETQNSPLHFAALNSQKSIIELLLRSAANPSIPNAHGLVPAELTQDKNIITSLMKPTWISPKNIQLGELEIEQIISAKNQITLNNNNNNNNNHSNNNDNNNNDNNNNNNDNKIYEEKKESKKNITITIPESKSELNLPNQGHTKFNTKINEPREKPNRRYSLPAGHPTIRLVDSPQTREYRVLNDRTTRSARRSTPPSMNPVHEEELLNPPIPQLPPLPQLTTSLSSSAIPSSTSSTTSSTSLSSHLITSTNTISPTNSNIHNLPLPFPNPHALKKDSPQHPKSKKTFANHQISRSNYNLQTVGMNSPLNLPSKSKKISTQQQSQQQSHLHQGNNVKSNLLPSTDISIHNDNPILPSVPLPPSPPPSINNNNNINNIHNNINSNNNSPTKLNVKSTLANIWNQTESDYSTDGSENENDTSSTSVEYKSLPTPNPHLHHQVNNSNNNSNNNYLNNLQQVSLSPVISSKDSYQDSNRITQTGSLSANIEKSRKISLKGNNSRSRSESDLDCQYDSTTGCILPPPSTSPSFPLSLNKSSPAILQEDEIISSDKDILDINQKKFFHQDIISPRSSTIEVAPIVPLEGQSHILKSDNSIIDESNSSPNTQNNLIKMNVGVQVSIEDSPSSLYKNNIENNNLILNDKLSTSLDVNEIIVNQNSPNTLQKKVLLAAKETALTYQLNATQLNKLREMFKACQQESAVVLESLKNRLTLEPELVNYRLVVAQFASEGSTLLHCASKWGNVGAVKFLLSLKDSTNQNKLVDVWARDLQGRVPLHLAAENSHEKVCKLLIAAMTGSDDDNDDNDSNDSGTNNNNNNNNNTPNNSNINSVNNSNNTSIKKLTERFSQFQIDSPHPTPHKKVNISVVGSSAPVDLTGTTPLGWASIKAKGRPSSPIRNLLFSPGDSSILPQKIYLERSGKTPIRKTKSNRITQFDSIPSYIVYAHSDAKGWRPEMEDRVIANSPLLNTINNDSYWLFGVCDGHGGDFSADFTAKSLPSILSSNIQKLYQSQSQSQLSYNSDNIINCLYRSCITVDEKLSEVERMKVSVRQTGSEETPKFSLNICDTSGSTACICLFNSEDLFIANIGDSRAVLAQHSILNPYLIGTIPLSTDQKLSILEERERAINSGFIVKNCSHDENLYEISTPLYPSLTLRLSRAIGDFYMKWRVGNNLPDNFICDDTKGSSSCPIIKITSSLSDYKQKYSTLLSPSQQGVSCEPVITHHKRIIEKDLFLLIACDGIWDVMKNEEATQFIYENLINEYQNEKNIQKNLHSEVNLQQITSTVCDLLLSECLNRNTSDNMTAILIIFPQMISILQNNLNNFKIQSPIITNSPIYLPGSYEEKTKENNLHNNNNNGNDNDNDNDDEVESPVKPNKLF